MIFEIKNASFSYPDNKKILNNINIKLEKGKILSILGPNGVGKTTLLRCMLGILKWQSGSSFLYGEDIALMPVRKFWSLVSYIPQAHTFSFSYTGLEMVLLGRSANFGLFGMPNKEDINSALCLMEKIGIADLANKDCNKLSGGQLQLLLIARELFGNPKLLVLDEPETGLDFYNQLMVLDMLKKLSKEDNISIIMNTHYPDNALSISDEAFIMLKDGSGLYGNITEVLTKENIKKAFNVDVLINELKYENKSFTNIVPIKRLS